MTWAGGGRYRFEKSDSVVVYKLLGDPITGWWFRIHVKRLQTLPWAIREIYLNTYDIYTSTLIFFSQLQFWQNLNIVPVLHRVVSFTFIWCPCLWSLYKFFKPHQLYLIVVLILLYKSTKSLLEKTHRRYSVCDLLIHIFVFVILETWTPRMLDLLFL